MLHLLLLHLLLQSGDLHIMGPLLCSKLLAVNRIFGCKLLVMLPLSCCIVHPAGLGVCCGLLGLGSLDSRNLLVVPSLDLSHLVIVLPLQSRSLGCSVCCVVLGGRGRLCRLGM